MRIQIEMHRAKTALVRVLPCLILFAFGVDEAAAQAQPTPSTERSTYTLGGPCVRKPDGADGIVRRDACNRWYCGSKLEVKNVSEAMPDLPQRLGCTWRIEVSNAGAFCICHKPETSPKLP
jgi:hypothetical protein